MKFSNKKIYYWDKVYRVKNFLKPSSFAKFCFNKIINPSGNKKLLELGCGDGRDAIFFSKKIHTVAIDKSKIAIKKLKKKKLNKKKISFICRDLNKIKFFELGKFDYIYMRFILHAVNEQTEKKIFHSLKKITKNKSLIMLEFRTDKDPLKKKGKQLSHNETFTDHYRRFINFKSFLKFLKHNSYKILYKIESKNLSIYKKDNPVLGRVIATK